MTLEAVAAIVAVLLSGFSLFRQERLSRTLHNSQSERGAIQQNVSLMVSLWNRIGETPSVLRFHSITESDLQAVGLTTEELAYLVSSFEAAAHYYEYIDTDTGPFPVTSLRYHMFATEDMRKAWPLLKRFFPGCPKFCSRIEQTILHHEQIASCVQVSKTDVR